MSSERYHTIARVGQLVEGIGQSFELEGKVIALFLADQTYYALDDFCPHKDLPLFDGLVIDQTVTCLAHGWRFSLADGAWLDNPRIRVKTYPVRVEGDEIQVALD